MSMEKVLDYLNLSGKGGGSNGKVVATPLQKSLLYAAKNGDCESLREIVNRRIGVQSKRQATLSDNYPENITPLHRAAENGFKDACSVLVESGCDMNKMDDYGRSALYLAASNDYPEVVKFLTEQRDCLLTCHLYGINHEGELAKIDKDSPLHRACEKGYLSVVQKLIQAGADVNLCICDYSLLFGDAPMHRAAKEGHVDCIKFLVDSGAKLEILNDDSNTPMHIAAYVGMSEVVQYLVMAGASIDVVNGKHCDCRDMARLGNSVAVDKYLSGITPTIFAAFAKKRAERDTLTNIHPLMAIIQHPSWEFLLFAEEKMGTLLEEKRAAEEEKRQKREEKRREAEAAKKLADEESERAKKELEDLALQAELDDKSTDMEQLVIQSPISKVMRKLSVNIGLFSSQKSDKSPRSDENSSVETDSSSKAKSTPRGTIRSEPAQRSGSIFFEPGRILSAALRGKSSNNLSVSEKVVPTIDFADAMNGSTTPRTDRLRTNDKQGEVEFNEDMMETNSFEMDDQTANQAGGGGGAVMNTDWRDEENVYKTKKKSSDATAAKPLPSLTSTKSSDEEGTPRKSYSSKKNNKSGKSQQGNMNW